MRPVALAAIWILLMTGPASAQFPPAWGPPPGGVFVFPGRGMITFGYGRPGFGYGWPAYGPVSGTTIIVQAPPTLMDPGAGDRLGRMLNRLPQVPPADERDILATIPRPARALPREPIPKRAAGPPLLAPRPAADKLEEVERQIKLGRDAFAAGEIGRAAERFRQAIELAPDRPLPHFLLAQAEFALSRYREAVVAVLAGLKLQPDWPTTHLDPRDLYDRNVIDHALDLERLRLAVERKPDDPALTFLYAYELWLNGRRDEARPLFERALPGAADPQPIRRFLTPPPPLPEAGRGDHER